MASSLALYVISGACLLSAVTSYLVGDVTTCTRYGCLVGERHRQTYNMNHAVTSTVDKYLGVPYARPPVGHLRFQAPEPPAAWAPSVRSARQHGSVCPQLVVHNRASTEHQDEDCLYLDIYTPHTQQGSGNWSVLVFIHGGSFEVGSGKLYDGTVLAQAGVVVVTINYRLGALGFLTSGDGHIPGNFGLLDQIAALRWVQDNIAAFGGDPGRVTVMGQSAGAASAGMLLLIPQARGLFRGVICMSGSPVAAYGVYPSSLDHRQYVRRVARLFDCPTGDNFSAVVRCLREDVDARSFIEKREQFPRSDTIDPEFKPHVDSTYIRDLPRRLFQRGDFYQVSVIAGTVKDEFANYFEGGARYNPLFDTGLDRYVQRYLGDQKLVDMATYVYTNWSAVPPGGLDRGALLSDIHMVAPTTDMSDLISAHHSSVYQYHFSLQHCFHSVDLNYVFGTPYSGIYADDMPSQHHINHLNQYTPAQRMLSDQMMKMWTNFVKTGVPASDDVTWSLYAPPNRSYLLLQPEDLTIKQNLRAHYVAFWNVLVPKLTGAEAGVMVSATTMRGDGQMTSRPVWVLLAAVGALVALVGLLTALLVRTRRRQRAMAAKPNMAEARL